jgi:hypothetical protein
VAQAVSRRLLTAGALVRFQASTCGICGGQSALGQDFFPRTSVFPCQCHSTGAALEGTMKNELIIFLTGLHSKPQGCGALHHEKNKKGGGEISASKTHSYCWQ